VAVGFLVANPAGDRVVYFSDEETDGEFDLWSVPLDGSATPTKVISDPAGNQRIGAEGGKTLQFTPDGTEMITLRSKRPLQSLHVDACKDEDGDGDRAC
jgi:hypothetical protein